MKTGELSKQLAVDSTTITNWINRYPDYFTLDARGLAGNIHRVYMESDVLVLNTIRHLRADNADWDTIAETLAAGQRVGEFPSNAIASDQRTIPVNQAEQSARAAATLAERDAALAEVERLRGELNAERRRAADDRAALMERIIELSREIGRLEGELKANRGGDG